MHQSWIRRAGALGFWLFFLKGCLWLLAGATAHFLAR
jgi:hypothetical protein